MYVLYKETQIKPGGEEKIISESKMYYANHKDLNVIKEIAATYKTKVFWLSLNGVN